MSRWLYIPMIIGATMTAVGQLAPPPAQPGGQMPPAPPALIGRMYAAYAHGAVPEQPRMDEALKPVAAMLERLEFTSYETVSVVDKEMPWSEETLFPINAKYTMKATPLQQREDGAIEMETHIEMLQDNGDYVDALAAKASAAPDKALMYRGMPLHNGELVVVFLVGVPQEEGQGQSQAQEGEQEQQEEQQAQQEQELGQEEGEGEQEQPQTSEKQEGENAGRENQVEEASEQEGEAPEGLENLDALLESLEDIDKREQVEERNQRDRIDFKGNWW